MLRPIRQLNPMPMRAAAQPIDKMKFRICARDAANAVAASLALDCAVSAMRSAAGTTRSASAAMSAKSGSILPVVATHCAKALL